MNRQSHNIGWPDGVVKNTLKKNCRILASFATLSRDLAKAIFLWILQIHTRLFYLDREPWSSIDISARLDVIPRHSMHKRHRLLLKRGALIERLCTVNTWHGSVILMAYASVGIGTVVIGPVLIGEHTLCAQNCLITGASHRYDDVSKSIQEQGLSVKEVVIEANVWIGANCIVLPGVRIGQHSVIGAGSVVTKDIPPFCVVVGNPARIVKRWNVGKGVWI